MVKDKTMLKKIFRKKEAIVTREIAQETILVPIKGKLADMQKIFMLNPVAKCIWQHLDGKRNLAEIRDRIILDFDINNKQVNRDIKEFVAQLVQAGLVEEK